VNNVYVYDIEVRTSPIQFTVTSTEGFSAEGRTSFTSTLELDLNLRFVDAESDNEYTNNPVRIPSLEADVVISEYGNYLKADASIDLNIVNSSGVALESSNALADIYLDGDFLGSFSSSPKLLHVKEGRHEIRVDLIYPDGSLEFDYSAFNITVNGTLEINPDGSLDVNVSLEGPDSAPFWEMMALVLRNQPFEKKLITAMEWISSIAGYPFPSDVDDITQNSDVSTLGNWLGNFSNYLESLPEVWEPTFSGFIDVAEMTVDFAKETLDVVETFVKKGLQIGEIILSIGEDYIELKLEDPVQKAVAKLTLKFLKGRISNLTFSIGDDILKSKVLKNLKNMGDALAVISVVISTFRSIEKTVKIMAGEGAQGYKEYMDIAHDFAQIVLKFWQTALNIIKSIASEYLAKLSLRIQRLSVVVLIIYLFVSELIKNCGDILKTLESLFLGFDELTVTWYCAIISMVALKAVGTIFSTAAATGVGIIIGVVAVIIILILNWDEFMAWLTHSLSAKQIKELQKGVKGSLQDTLNLTARLNDMRPSSHVVQTRYYYNLYGEMLRRSYFARDEAESSKFQNLSNYAFDFYKAYRDMCVNAVRTTSAAKLIWFIANDFDNTYYYHGRNTATAVLTVNNEVQYNPDIYFLLSGIGRDEAEELTLEYFLTDYPNQDAYNQWQSDLESVSDFLSESIERFQNAMGRLKFLNVFPDPVNYTREYGAIIIEYENWAGLYQIDLSIQKKGGGKPRTLGSGDVPDIGSEVRPVISPSGLPAYRKDGFWYYQGYSMQGTGKLDRWMRVTDPRRQEEYDNMKIKNYPKKNILN